MTPAAEVVIVGGGVAGIEALLALHDFAGERARLTLIADRPDFIYKPLLVEEPFGELVEHRELAPMAGELGADFVQAALAEVRPADHQIVLSDGSSRPYDQLMICVGGRFRPAFTDVTTFPDSTPLTVEELLTKAHARGRDAIAFVVPPGAGWSLPLYELALMIAVRAQERGYRGLAIRLLTPEQSPLAVFGPIPGAAVAEMLTSRGIEFSGGTSVRERNGGLVCTPGDEKLEGVEVVALPVMDGPSIPGLPGDEQGFITVDEHSRVKGVEDIYAAGDGTTFPIKQGGLATQQADAAAAHLAHRLGAAVEVEPFRPVLRGKLLTGAESLNMRSEVSGGRGFGEASLDALWWPPDKISGRYLAPWLYHADPPEDPEPPGRALDVEISLPQEWHSDPMALDPHRTPEVD